MLFVFLTLGDVLMGDLKLGLLTDFFVSSFNEEDEGFGGLSGSVNTSEILKRKKNIRMMVSFSYMKEAINLINIVLVF